MKKILSIAKKELTTYFQSPIAYIVLIITITVFNIFFYVIIDENREATLRDVFTLMEFMFVFIVPLLTMKVFAEEKASGTMEFLMTTPTTNTAIVLGKYLGSLIFFTVLIGLTFPYYFIIEYYGSPDATAVLIGYVGIWLEGAFFLAIGILTSSWTRNQILAALSSYLILFLLYFSISFIEYLPEYIQPHFRYLGVWSHAENFYVGLLLTSDLVYFLSGIFFCITLTRLSIENKIWR